MAHYPYTNIGVAGPYQHVLQLRSARGRGVWHAAARRYDDTLVPVCRNHLARSAGTYTQHVIPITEVDADTVCKACLRDHDHNLAYCLTPAGITGAKPNPTSIQTPPPAMVRLELWYSKAMSLLAEPAEHETAQDINAELVTIANYIRRAWALRPYPEIDTRMRHSIDSTVARLTARFLDILPDSHTTEQSTDSSPTRLAAMCAARLAASELAANILSSNDARLKDVTTRLEEPSLVASTFAMLAANDPQTALHHHTRRITREMMGNGRLMGECGDLLRHLDVPPGGYRPNERPADAVARSLEAYLNEQVTQILGRLLDDAQARLDSAPTTALICLDVNAVAMAFSEPSAVFHQLVDCYTTDTIPDVHGRRVWIVIAAPKPVIDWMHSMAAAGEVSYHTGTGMEATITWRPHAMVVPGAEVAGSGDTAKREPITVVRSAQIPSGDNLIVKFDSTWDRHDLKTVVSLLNSGVTMRDAIAAAPALR